MRRLALLVLLWTACPIPVRSAPDGIARSSAQDKAGGPKRDRHPPAAPDPASTRASPDYSLVAEGFDGGGAAMLSSANYAIKNASAGATGALAASASYTGKGGYAGQLYETIGLATDASPDTVPEDASRQLSAGLLLDDRSQLPLAAGAVTRPVADRPGSFPAPVAPPGLVTAATVYQNTAARIRAAYAGYSAVLGLTVLNVNPDDYGSYAGDGIDDAWQVFSFGFDNPRAAPGVDADSTGQNNLFKYLAGLDPLDPNSRFTLLISPVTGQPEQKTLTFSPRYDGRTYTVQSSTSLTQADWKPLANSATTDDGTTRSVTDLAAGSSAARFYRVQISTP